MEGVAVAAAVEAAEFIADAMSKQSWMALSLNCSIFSARASLIVERSRIEPC